jgi:hypothetical protein
LIVELFLNPNWVGARVVMITSYSNSEGGWSCCANVNYAHFKEKFGLCQVNANLANDCHKQQWILPFILPSSTSAKMCNNVIDNGVLSKLAARVCFHVECNNKDVGDSNQINTFNPNFPRRESAPSTSSNTPQ